MMKIEQIYTGCLAQGAYYIESNNEVAIIDPLREVQPYIDMAANKGAKIKYIFETHFHADFVSGHVSLAKKTGATIIYGPNAETKFESTVAADNEIFELGDVKIKVLHTPGHTMESTCFLLIDETGKEHALFSGDTLFLGDVGRPDLAQKAADMTQEELAGTLFESLRTKIMTLPDATIIYPGHGAGSACGKNMSKETVGTIGEQKASNYALRADMTKEEFVKEVTDGLLPPPAYFPLNVGLNKSGYEDVSTIIENAKGLTPDEFEAVANSSGALVLDVRHQNDFLLGHIPNSIFIGIDGGFAPWVGSLIKDTEQPLLIITPAGQLKETITRLSRVGFDNVLGFLEGGFDSWMKSGKEVDQIKSISAEELAILNEDSKIDLMDVRKLSEYTSERAVSALHTPLTDINDYLEDYKKNELNYVYCGGGYRSVIAASILKSRGIHNLVNIEGGFASIKNTKLPLTEYVCPNS